MAALFEVWFFVVGFFGRFVCLFVLRSSNLGCPGEGLCNPWLPTSNIYEQPDPEAFVKGVGQAVLCQGCAGSRGTASGWWHRSLFIWGVFYQMALSSCLSVLLGSY